MKKVLIVLLAFAVAGGLFAQDVSFSGQVRSGLRIDFGDNYDDAVIAANDDDGDNAVFAELVAEYDADDWGLKFGASAQKGTGAPELSVGDAFGWIYFADRLIKLSGGQQGGDWGSGGWVDSDVGGGISLKLAVFPFDGFNIGAYLGYPNGSGYSAGKIANFFQETALGFSFDGGLFNISAGMELFSEESDDYADLDMKFVAGVGISAIDLLTLHISFGAFDLLGDGDTLMKAGLNIDVNGLPIGLGFVLPGIEIQDGLQLLHLEANVDFGVTEVVTIGAGLGVDFDGDFDLIKVNFDPWASFDVGGPNFKLGYGFEMGGANYTDDLNHYIKLVLGWSF